jgi:hypothetical protein
MFFRRLLGLGPTKKQKDQLNILNQYINKRNVHLDEEDPKYRFKKCTDFEKEKSSNPPLTNEYFLKIGDKYAYLGNTSKLEFFPDHIGTQIGLNRLSQDYHEQLYNFLNNYLFIRVTLPNPLPSEQRGLLKAFMQDDQRSNEQRKSDEQEKQRQLAAQPGPHESENEYWLRRKQEIFLDPDDCAGNFRTYLDTRVASEDFMNAYIGQKIFNILVASIGTEFEKRRLKLNPSQINIIRNYANHADTEQLKEQFIAYLCKTPENPLSYHTNHTKARVILEKVYFPKYESINQNEYQQSEPTTPNKLQALIWCLEYFEEFLLKQADETQTQTEGTQTPGTQTQGGKSKSKSTRKKRFSHRKKKCHRHSHSHSHKHKHKRRAPNTKQYCH